LRDLGDVIQDAFELLKSKPLVALTQACIASDITSKKYTGMNGKRDNRVRFEKFFNDYKHIIMSSGRIKLIVQGELRIGTLTIQELLYKLIRCGLVHDGDIDENVILVEDKIGIDENNKILIKADIIEGLLLTNVLCNSNKEIRCKDNFLVEMLFERYPINSLWGREDLFYYKLEELKRRQ